MTETIPGGQRVTPPDGIRKPDPPPAPPRDMHALLDEIQRGIHDAIFRETERRSKVHHESLEVYVREYLARTGHAIEDLVLCEQQDGNRALYWLDLKANVPGFRFVEPEPIGPILDLEKH